MSKKSRFDRVKTAFFRFTMTLFNCCVFANSFALVTANLFAEWGVFIEIAHLNVAAYVGIPQMNLQLLVRMNAQVQLTRHP
jgi:hypothetical protein